MDLGTKRDESKESLPVRSSPDMPDTLYPSFSLDGDKAKEFAEESKADLNSTITGRVKLKLTGLRNDRYGSSLSFDILSIDDMTISGDDGDGESDAEKATEGEYDNPAIARLMRHKKS